jgi:hypothetical protein
MRFDRETDKDDELPGAGGSYDFDFSGGSAGSDDSWSEDTLWMAAAHFGFRL